MRVRVRYIEYSGLDGESFLRSRLASIAKAYGARLSQRPIELHRGRVVVDHRVGKIVVREMILEAKEGTMGAELVKSISNLALDRGGELARKGVKIASIVVD